MPRRSKPYLASGCSCLFAHHTVAAGKPPFQELPPLPSRPSARRVASRPTGHAVALEGPTASLLKRAVYGHLSSLPPPPAPSKNSSRFLSSPPPPSKPRYRRVVPHHAVLHEVRVETWRAEVSRGTEGGTYFAPGLLPSWRVRKRECKRTPHDGDSGGGGGGDDRLLRSRWTIWQT